MMTKAETRVLDKAFGKSRPILFTDDMVRAILNGRKTQTRRPMKVQPSIINDGDAAWRDSKGDLWRNARQYARDCCPFGSPGDRLWVREAFYIDHVDYADGQRLPKIAPDDATDMLYYPADARCRVSWCCQVIPECSCGEVGKPKLRPSILMPRWASRLTLEITSVRAERIKDISLEDAKSEGLPYDEECYGEHGPGYAAYARGLGEFCTYSACVAFPKYWDETYGNGAYDRNDWVWVIEFKRI